MPETCLRPSPCDPSMTLKRNCFFCLYCCCPAIYSQTTQKGTVVSPLIISSLTSHHHTTSVHDFPNLHCLLHLLSSPNSLTTGNTPAAHHHMPSPPSSTTTASSPSFPSAPTPINVLLESRSPLNGLRLSRVHQSCRLSSDHLGYLCFRVISGSWFLEGRLLSRMMPTIHTSKDLLSVVFVPHD